MKVRVRKIGEEYGVVLPKKIMERLGVTEGSTLVISVTDSGVHISPLDHEFADQLAAFRRTEAKHRNSFRELAK